MQWVKSHLAIVISGSVGLIAIALLVLGMLSSAAAEQMQQDAGIANSLQSVNGANPAMIDEARKQRDELAAKVQRAIKELEQIGQHKPLVPEVFVPTQLDNSDKRFQFRDRFKERQQQLMVMLNAGGMPTAEDIKHEVERIEDAKLQAERQKVLGFDSAPKGPGGPRTPLPPRPVTPTPGVPQTPEDRLSQNPETRVSIRRARSIYCYATPMNLDPQPAVLESAGRPPSIEDIWYAQMSLWIQEDVLGAIARLNQRVAEQLPEGERSVLSLPVKRIGYIAVGNYVPASSGGGAAGGAPPPMSRDRAVGPPPGNADAVFTGRGGDETKDVIQFTLELVVSARMLPAVINEICDAGFYTPLLVTYEQEPPNLDFVGYIYGSEPVLKVRLEFEGCFLRSKYAKWMPETVVTAIKEGRAGKSQSGAPGGGFPGGGPGIGPGPMRGRGLDEGV